MIFNQSRLTSRKMHSYWFSSILTFSLTYSWHSFYGFQFLTKLFQKEFKSRSANVPVYMWDIYKNGVNASDVVKGVLPKYLGTSFDRHPFRNHQETEIEFEIPNSKEDEFLIKAEIRLMIDRVKKVKPSFQIYIKGERWIFMDEKRVRDVESKWMSLEVTSTLKGLKGGSVRFLILTLSNRFERRSLSPILLLSYLTRSRVRNGRKKRGLELEDYEEKTNRIWNDDEFDKRFSKAEGGVRDSCRRTSLWIEFSEIDYDNWIVAPKGYEAYQCVGKCSFPVGEHLSPTKHAILQTLLHNLSPSKASTACCVPTKLEPISILYIDDNGVLTYRFRYHDMVVAECGCR